MVIMSNLTTAINVNVDAKTKEEATTILKGLGLNMSTAINMFLTQIVKRDGIPFKIENPHPSKEMIRALKQAEDIIEGKVNEKGYNSAEEMLEDILNDRN